MHVQGPSDAVLAKVRRAIAELADGTTVRVAQADEPADRTVVIAPGTGWIAVYDEAGEAQDDSLGALAKLVSRATAGVVVSVLVHDDDVLEMALYRAGAAKDQFTSHPNYSGRVSERERRKLSGRAAVWRDVLAASVEEAQLAQAFATADARATSALQQIASLLGIESERCLTGYNYLSREGGLPDRHIVLRFANILDHVAAGTPPRLAPGGAMGPGRGSCYVGDKLHVSVSAINTGGSAQGVDVSVWGEALDRELLQLEVATLEYGSERRAKRNPVSASFERASSVDGTTTWVASFPQFAFPAGAKRKSRGLLQALFGFGSNSDEMLRAVVAGRAHRLGTGSYHVQLACGTEREAVHSATFQLQVAELPRRPLKCLAATTPHALAPLVEDQRLFALISFGAVDGAAAVAFELIQSFGTLWRPTDDLRIEGLPGARGDTEIEGAASTVLKDSTRTLRDGLLHGTQIHGTQYGKGAGSFAVLANSNGFVFGRHILANQNTASVLPSLLLWIGTDGLDAHQIARAKELADVCCELVMTQHHGVQALVGRWGWQGFLLDHNMYESACGINSKVTLHSEWQKRFLRGVTHESHFLGPELSARLNDRAALHVIADVQPVGLGLVVRPHANTNLDALERALEPLLPSESDSRAALERYRL